MCKTVLIVEDEYLIARDLELFLEDSGWRVLGPVATVGDALALLQNELPAVALLDVDLADGAATPLALALKEIGIPFAVASAYSSPEQYGGEVFAGAPNMGKPANNRRLLAALDQLVGS